MPGSIHDLTRKLVAAIDSQGNVREMGAVVEVVSALETASVTAEELRATRIGRYVNLIRRRLSDKALAKRMKQLVKQWQSLLQSPTVPNGPTTLAPSHAVNGVAGGVRKDSTSPMPPSPVESPHPSPRSTSTSPQAIGVSGTPPVPAASVDTGRCGPPPSASRQTDPTAQRMKILQRLSKVKTQPPLPQQLLTTQTHPPQPHTPSLSTATADNHSHTDTPASLRHPAPPVPVAASLRHPAPPVAVAASLGHPAPPVAVAAYLIHPAPPVPVAGSTEPSGVGDPPLPSSLPLSFPLANSLPQRPDDSEEVLELLVQIPRHLLMQVPSEHRDEQPSLPEVVPPSEKRRKRPRRMVVSVLLHKLPSQPSRTAVPTDHSLSDASLDDLSRVEGVGPPRPHTMPDGAIVGVDGCHGHDGLWYGWMEAIPGKEFSVTVLPYVYIDGAEDPV